MKFIRRRARRDRDNNISSTGTSVLSAAAASASLQTTSLVPQSPIATPATPAIEEFLYEDRQSHTDGGIQKDPWFYGVPLILLVERTLYKVPRSYFERHSELFLKAYLFRRQCEDGLSDERPLRLEGVCAAEFKCLLRAMIREDLEEDVDMSWTQWTSVLKLSLMWEMKMIQDLALKKIPTRIHNLDEWIAALRLSTRLRIGGLREMAVRELANHQLNPLKKIELGIECSIAPWLTEGYRVLVMRPDCISEEDEEQLGQKRTANLFRMRHRYLEYTAYRQPLGDDIQTTFASEFADMVTFHSSTVSYLRSDLRTETDPNAIQHDETYYCADTIFFVEDTLFKVPRYLFEDNSDVFRDMFLLPSPEGVACDGSSDEQPLFLEGIPKVAFQQLLRAMKFPVSRYPWPAATSKSRNSPSTMSHEEPMVWSDWVLVLELACMWQMEKVRETAIKKILEYRFCASDEQKVLLRLSTKMGIQEIRDRAIQTLSRPGALQPIELVQLGIECQVDSWLLQGYKQLVEASSGISVETEEQLGWTRTSKLFRIRDEYLQGRYPYNKTLAGQRWNRDSNLTNRLIKDVFAEELKDAGWVDSEK